MTEEMIRLPFDTSGKLIRARKKTINGQDVYEPIVITDGIDEETILKPATRTTNGDTKDTPIDAGSYNVLTFILDISEINGTNPTLDINILYKDPATGKWLTATSFQQQTAVLSEPVSISVPVRARYYAVAWTIGGTNASFTFSVGVAKIRGGVYGGYGN